MDEERKLKVTLMRGGTSKGVFIKEAELPEQGPARDSLLLDLMGSPDPMQLDGLGGTHTSTSKVIVLQPSTAAGVDVDYRFAQIGIETATVDETGNCGNLTSAVGPYAIDEGWVAAREPATTVVLRNLNTGRLVRAQVPVHDGRAAGSGSQLIAGLPTPGPRIVTDYLDPAGSIFGTTFPTGNASDQLTAWAGSPRISIVDVAHPVAFASADAVGLADADEPAGLNANSDAVERIEAFRQACAALLPLRTASLNLPRLVLLRSREHAAQANADISVIGTSAGRVHHALPVTSILCAAAATSLAGTVPNDHAAELLRPGGVTIHHPKGNVEATVELSPSGDITSVGIVRTARRLLDGIAYLPVRRSTAAEPVLSNIEEGHAA